MDADYTSDLGHTLNSRQENYRLTHPDSGIGSNPALTGVDTGAHATQGRATLNPPESSVQWSTSGNHRTTTAEAELTHTNSRTNEYRSTEFGTTPAANTGSVFNSGSVSNNSGGSPFGTPTTTSSNNSAFGTAAPTTSSTGSSFGTTAPVTNSSNSSFGTAPASHASSSSYGSAPSGSNSSSYSNGTSATNSASPFETATPAAHAAPPAATTATAAITSARAASAAPPSTIEPQHVMRLLLASHDLDTAATKAEAGEGSVDDLARAAHRTRAAAVELISAWYGGTDHMRNFAEALLQAASETA